MRQEFAHDLALELGCTVAALGRMSEREFRQWMAYAAKRMLPTRRLEVYLAQIASVIAQCAGNSEMSIRDFLIELKAATPPPITAEQEAQVFASFGKTRVIKLGQGRKT